MHQKREVEIEFSEVRLTCKAVTSNLLVGIFTRFNAADHKAVK
jgi:hypothetical protein